MSISHLVALKLAYWSIIWDRMNFSAIHHPKCFHFWISQIRNFFGCRSKMPAILLEFALSGWKISQTTHYAVPIHFLLLFIPVRYAHKSGFFSKPVSLLFLLKSLHKCLFCWDSFISKFRSLKPQAQASQISCYLQVQAKKLIHIPQKFQTIVNPMDPQ